MNFQQIFIYMEEKKYSNIVKVKEEATIYSALSAFLFPSFSRSPVPVRIAQPFAYQSFCQIQQNGSQEWSKYKKGGFAISRNVNAAET